MQTETDDEFDPRAKLTELLNSREDVVPVDSYTQGAQVKAEAFRSDAFHVERDGEGGWQVRYVDPRTEG